MDFEGLKEKITRYLAKEKGKKGTHLPGYNYCGPGTPIVTNVLTDVPPINGLDAGCQVHDVEYMEFAGDAEEIKKSDQRLIEVARNWRKNPEYLKKRGLLGKAVDWLASKSVDVTFQGKKALESLKIIDPVKFTANLAVEDQATEQQVGQYLKKKLNEKKYVNNYALKFVK